MLPPAEEPAAGAGPSPEQEASHGGSEDAAGKLCCPEDTEEACSDAELSVDRLSLLCTATASEVFAPPLPIELDVLLLHSSVKSSLMVLVVVPSEL